MKFIHTALQRAALVEFARQARKNTLSGKPTESEISTSDE
jgi:hypothetical protein